MENPSIMSHVSLGTNQFDKAIVFYERVLAVIGARRIMEHPGAVAYGRQLPEFWIQTPFDGAAATVGNGVHIAFFAADTGQVDAFYEAALAAGGRGEGPPGPRPHYGPEYYGCFVRDLDGNKVEATFWDTSKSPSS